MHGIAWSGTVLGRMAPAAVLLWLGAASAQAAAPIYDMILRGGTIVDGSGLPRYRGDVAITGGHIAAIGDLQNAEAASTIDASGLVVAPGFINIHSHAEADAVATAVNVLTQGVTTEITNADGGGSTDIAMQLTRYAQNGLAINLGKYIGFNAVWAETVGSEDRRAAAEDIELMRATIDRNMAAGGWGVSAGLDYKPGYFARPEEVVQVVSAARRWRTNFPNHDRLRPEDRFSSYKGMAETIAIAEQAGLVPVITHIKSQGSEQGNAPAVISLMEEAIARGTYTATDVYPYLAGQTGLAALIIPGWALEGGRDAMLKRFADPAQRSRIIEAAEAAMALRFGGPGGVYILDTGRELTDVMKDMQAGAGESVLRLLEQGASSAILRFGSEKDLVTFLRFRNSAIACDCGATLRDRVHPRQWGTFPRILGRYVRDDGILSLEDAVRKMTALPATIIGMVDRGYVAPGMVADIMVFDPASIMDHATYQDPTRPSVGVRHVLVNGRPALLNGVPTHSKSGERLLRSPHMPSRPMTGGRLRSISASGPVGKDMTPFTVNIDVEQPADAYLATGSLELVDVASGERWLAEQLGVVQIAPGWASVTATIRNEAGFRRAAIVTLDQTVGSESRTLVLRLDGGKELTGLVP